MPTVLIISHGHPELSHGGAEVAAYALFRGLRSAPDTTAYFLARTDDPAYRRAGMPLSVFRSRADELLMFSDDVDPFVFAQRSREVVDHFSRLVGRIRPDIVHFHHYTGIGLDLIAETRRLRPRTAIVLTLHEFLAICHHHGLMVKTGSLALCGEATPHDCAACFPDRGAAAFARRKSVIRAQLDAVDRFVAPSEFLRRRYLAWGLPAARLVAMDNGVAPAAEAPPRPLAAGGRRAVFGFFGQVHPFKGLVPLLQAVAALPPSPATADIRLVVNGAYLELNDPGYIETVTALLARTAGRVRFAGPYDHAALPRLMGEVDWVVAPSLWWENAPVVIEEALAHRRPVLCSNIGGMAEKIVPGRDGLHFPVGDVAALAALIAEVGADPALWDGLRQRMRPPATIADAVAAHLALYRDLTAG